jgi:hypothetical protein
MIRMEYDPNLVEQTVFLAARRDARLECDLHQAVDPFYKMADEEGRSRAFREVTGEFFRRLHLDRIVPSFVAERPLIGQHIRACVVFEAAHGKAQSADVFVKEESAGGEQTQRTLVIRLCPESLLDAARLAPWLRRELLHAEDMVDPVFGYSVNDIAGEPHERRLVLDRYRVLWDIYVEARLVREGRSEAAKAPRLWEGFVRALTYREHRPSREAFEMFLCTDRLTHRQLLGWASDPRSLCPACDGDTGERNLSGLVLC